jgi:hypothetical protein
MHWRRSTGTLLAMAASCLFLGCPSGGEFGDTTFQLGGGLLPGDGWDPNAAIASGSSFTVTASAVAEDGTSLPAELHSSDEAVLVPTAEDDASHAWASFVAGQPGLATVNLVDREQQVWLDGLDLEVREADSVDLRLAGERTVPDAFAVALGSVMAARAVLSDGDGEVLSHWDVAVAEVDDPSLEVDAGGDVLKITPRSPGEATVTVATAEGSAAANYRVDTIYASSISQLQLAVHQRCGVEQATVVAEPTTADGLPVLGQQVVWSVPEGTTAMPEADTVLVALQPTGAAPVLVTAAVAGLSTTVEITPADCEPAACALGSGTRGAPTGALLLLVAVTVLIVRRRP